MILLITLHVKQNKTNLIKNAIHIIRELELVTLQLKDNLSDRTSKIGVRMILSKLQVRGTPCKCCSKSQQRSSPGLRLRLTALLVFSCENHLVGSDLLCAGGHTNTYTHNKAPMTQLHSIHTHCCLSKWPHQKTNQFIGRWHPYGRKFASKTVLSGLQFTLHLTRRTLDGASRLVQAMSA